MQSTRNSTLARNINEMKAEAIYLARWKQNDL